MSLESGRFTLFQLPKPTKLSTNFVYNFFVNDERVNENPSPSVVGVKNENLSKIVENSALPTLVPRYVEVNFAPPSLSLGGPEPIRTAIFDTNIGQKSLESINSPESMTNFAFSSMNESDDKIILRMREKLNGLSKSLGLNFSDSDQSKKLAKALNISQDEIQSIISPLHDEKYLVNTKKNVGVSSTLQNAAKYVINSQISKKLASICVNSADDTSPLSKLDVETEANKITKDYNKVALKIPGVVIDYLPLVVPSEKASEISQPANFLDLSIKGYLLTRHRYGEDGRKKSSSVFYLPGYQNTKYLDTKVAYGVSYSYDVRAVYEILAIFEGTTSFDEETNKNWLIKFLATSLPTQTSSVRTEEFEPPKEPDGVFYNFNYDKEKGLIIRWQMPSGKSRDTKYFQIFRRKTIFEPFVCIAQLDFDDSKVKTLIPEQVRKDKVLKFPRARTFFEDTEFTRSDKYIYAVTAVDAHGFTSGYSAQTEVGFNKTKNELTLKAISRGGAPKQYPNFYVDPKLDDNIANDSFTQDAIFDSGHSKMTVYFTPDARFITGEDKNSNKKVFYTQQEGGKYSMNFINLDVQKSATTEFVIKDYTKEY